MTPAPAPITSLLARCGLPASFQVSALALRSNPGSLSLSSSFAAQRAQNAVTPAGERRQLPGPSSAISFPSDSPSRRAEPKAAALAAPPPASLGADSAWAPEHRSCLQSIRKLAERGALLSGFKVVRVVGDDRIQVEEHARKNQRATDEGKRHKGQRVNPDKGQKLNHQSQGDQEPSRAQAPFHAQSGLLFVGHATSSTGKTISRSHAYA